jgi:hypothetical protein
MTVERVVIIERLEIELDTTTAAKWFANLSDDDMADFLIKVAEEAQKYPSDPNNQWYYLGGHLRNCACSTDLAREMVKAWAHWIDHSEHGKHP